MSVDLSTLSLAQVTDLYNLIAEKAVKKFENKVKGVARLEALLLATSNEVFVADGEYDVRPVATEEGFIVLTDLEYGMMDTIAHAEHNPTNGATPTQKSDVHTWLWADEFGKALGISAQAAGGVLSSLEQKGAIQMDVGGKKDDHGVWFTQNGFDSWQAEHNSGRVFAVQKRSVKARIKGGKRGPAPEYSDDMVVDVLVANPKKAGSASYARFAIYKNGMTVAQFLAAGGTRADLAWDSERSFISIGKAH